MLRPVTFNIGLPNNIWIRDRNFMKCTMHLAILVIY
jgi:hypothetical protein